MNKQVSILYEIKTINDLMFLFPKRVLIGQTNETKDKFYDELSSITYLKTDYMFDYKLQYIFDDVIDIEILKEKYKENYLNKYLQSFLENVYFIDLSDDSCNLQIYNKKDFQIEYGLSVNYNTIPNDENKFDVELYVETLEEELSEEENYELNVQKDIKYLLSNYKNKVMFQDEPIEELLFELYSNYVLSNDKSNIIICGEEGVGKTKILKEIEKCFSVPVLIQDFNSLNFEEYYDMREIGIELISKLINKSNNDLTLAQNGIIIIDQMDDYDYYAFINDLYELAKSIHFILNKESIKLQFTNSNEIINFDTSNLTIILSGQFKKLLKEVEQSIEIPIEFFSEKSKIKKFKKGYTSEDLDNIYYIYEDLFNYFDTVITFNTLSKNKIKEILLKSEDSPLKYYKNVFKNKNIKMNKIPNSVIDYISKKAYKDKTNCKYLKSEFKSIFKNCLMDIMKSDENNLELEIKNDIMYNPEGGYQLKKKKIK